MILRTKAFKVQMRSGSLLREVLTGEERIVSSLVKDSVGRIFRVESCEEVEYNGMGLTKLYPLPWI